MIILKEICVTSINKIKYQETSSRSMLSTSLFTTEKSEQQLEQKSKLERIYYHKVQNEREHLRRKLTKKSKENISKMWVDGGGSAQRFAGTHLPLTGTVAWGISGMAALLE